MKTPLTKLFGTSGIRGIANRDVTPQLAIKVGQALAMYKKAGSILIAHDSRTTSQMLQRALAAGITACGATVLKQGMVPTPVLAYLTGQIKADAGIMITASHNPPEYNGIKLYNSDTTAYTESQQNQIEELITRRKFKLAPWRNIGRTTSIDETARYVELITKNVKLEENWRIIIDPGNGATSQLAPKLFRELNCDVVTVNAHPDGHFHGRGAEPNEESLRLLAKIVRKLKADLGVAYDGDGDRMLTVDEKGALMPLDQTLAAFAAYRIGRERRNKTVVTHVETSMCMETMLEARGGRVVRTKVGDVTITEAIKQHDAIFGGEPCGAWINPSFHYCPDGILSSVLLLEALERNNQSMSEFVSGVPRYPLLRENIVCANSIKHTVVKRGYKTLLSIFPDVTKHSKVDGLRLTLRHGWLLIRPSGTEPAIRITVEAETRKAAEAVMRKATKLMNKLVKEESQ